MTAVEHRLADATEADLGGFWDGRAEGADDVARKTVATMQRLEFLCPVDGWRYPNGNEWGMWPTSSHEQTEWIESQISRSEDGDPEPEYGYFFSLSQEVEGLFVEMAIMAGGSARGGRVPVNSVGVEVRELVTGAFTTTVVDPITAAVVEVWEPLAATFVDQTVIDLARPTSSWQIPFAYRIWVNDSVGSISQVAEGVRVSRLGEGTLLSAPDEWTTQRVVEAMRETLTLNDIDEVPH